MAVRRARTRLFVFILCMVMIRVQTAASEQKVASNRNSSRSQSDPTDGEEVSTDTTPESTEENGSPDSLPPAFAASNFEADAPFDGVPVALAEEEVQSLPSADVESINGEDSTWVAVTYEDFDGVDLRTKTGAILDPDSFKSLPMIVHADSQNPNDESGADDIPESFDARVQWPNCTTIGTIRTQGTCGSCWAVAAASIMSDRICIHKNEMSTSISSMDLINCCGIKCAPSKGDGCQGGYPDQAFEYWQRTGLPTEQCQAYVPKFGKCAKACDSAAPAWGSDLRFGAKSYRIKPDVKEIQQELMKFGPVEVAFSCTQDFVNYKSGVFQHKTGKSVGGHAMRLIGWGVEGGTPFWLIANSWGTKWGENGFVRFLRGSNHMDIEKWVSTGAPK